MYEVPFFSQAEKNALRGNAMSKMVRSVLISGMKLGLVMMLFGYVLSSLSILFCGKTPDPKQSLWDPNKYFTPTGVVFWITGTCLSCSGLLLLFACGTTLSRSRNRMASRQQTRPESPGHSADHKPWISTRLGKICVAFAKAFFVAVATAIGARIGDWLGGIIASSLATGLAIIFDVDAEGQAK